VTSQLDDASADMEKKLAPKGPGIVRWLELPKDGKSAEWLKDELDSLSRLPSSNWQSGKVSGTVYHGGEELEHVISSAMNKYIISNPLHPDVFPGVRKMEAEVVKMVLELFNAPPEAGGTVTSGGTESILMACKSYRDWARDVKGITEPEMIAPNSIHAAFDKAAHYFGIKIHYIRVDEKTRKVDIARVKRAINPNTVMVRCLNNLLNP
jgi:sphinganine-1-phosphate aldolase